MGVVTGDGPESIYWQYNKPLSCPKGHEMLWLGSDFWICGKGKCNRIYVQEKDNAEEETQKEVGHSKAAGSNS